MMFSIISFFYRVSMSRLASLELHANAVERYHAHSVVLMGLLQLNTVALPTSIVVDFLEYFYNLCIYPRGTPWPVVEGSQQGCSFSVPLLMCYY